MRRTPVFLAVTALVAVALVGCSSPADASCTPGAEDPALLDLVDVSGPFASQPDVELRTPLHTSTTSVASAETGAGLSLTEDGQLALIDLTVYSGDSGDSVVGTRYADDLASVPSISQIATTFPTLGDDLHCASEGSRVVVALAPDDIPDESAAQLRLGDDESAVLVVDVRKVYLPKADGADQYTESHGLPTVVRAPDGRPGVIVPDAAAPTDLVVQTIKRGDGAEVTADAPVRVHYTGVVWDSREVFDSTWESGEPASLSLDGVVPGLATALEGQTVGSQVLVVIPPDLAYGDQAQGLIPANATLVFVVDILGIDE